MRTKSTFLVGCLLSISPLQAQEYLAVENYKCSEFLADAEKPDDPARLMRSLVTIAWATGFAAAHQQRHIRADAKAMQLVAVIAGDACRKDPDRIAVEVIAPTITRLAGPQKK